VTRRVLFERVREHAEILATIPRDPWSEGYVYIPPHAPGTRPVLSSKGIDGIAGTSDDIRLETNE
jgi:Type II secretion system (T2SS), protein G